MGEEVSGGRQIHLGLRSVHASRKGMVPKTTDPPTLSKKEVEPWRQLDPRKRAIGCRMRSCVVGCSGCHITENGCRQQPRAPNAPLYERHAGPESPHCGREGDLHAVPDVGHPQEVQSNPVRGLSLPFLSGGGIFLPHATSQHFQRTGAVRVISPIRPLGKRHCSACQQAILDTRRRS